MAENIETSPSQDQLHRERWELLEHIDEATEQPLIILGFVWLILLIIDFTAGLNPFLQILSNAIWIIFIVDFAIEFIIAPDKLDYFKRKWLTAISLVLPALRVLSVFRAFRLLRLSRATRTISLLRTLTSINRGIRSVKQVLGKRGIGYLITITLIVIFVGSAALSVFESQAALLDSGLADGAEGLQLATYSDAVWWTAAMMTGLGADGLPATAEGRIIAWMLSVYALAVFGYITATIATYFIGVDNDETTLKDEIHALRSEIMHLRSDLTAKQSTDLSS